MFITIEKWNVENICGYKPMTTLWEDFCIAEAFGTDAIRYTFKRVFAEWKDNYKYLTELVMVLNHKIWRWYEKNEPFAKVYDELWRKADQYAVDNLKEDELRYYFNITDQEDI